MVPVTVQNPTPDGQTIIIGKALPEGSGTDVMQAAVRAHCIRSSSLSPPAAYDVKYPVVHPPARPPQESSPHAIFAAADAVVDLSAARVGHGRRNCWLPNTRTSSPWAGTGILLALTGLFTALLRNWILADPHARSLVVRRFSRLRKYALFAHLGWFLVVVYFLGWGWTVKHWLIFNNQLLPGSELLLLAPLLAGLVLSWALYYDVDMALKRTALYHDETEPPGRWTQVGLQARYNFLLLAPPCCLPPCSKRCCGFSRRCKTTNTSCLCSPWYCCSACSLAFPGCCGCCLGCVPCRRVHCATVS